MKQFNLEEKDMLDWTLSAEHGEIVVIVKPEKHKK